MQDNTIQYNSIQCKTIQYNTIQYNTAQYNTIQYNTIQYNKIQYNIRCFFPSSLFLIFLPSGCEDDSMAATCLGRLFKWPANVPPTIAGWISNSPR